MRDSDSKKVDDFPKDVVLLASMHVYVHTDTHTCTHVHTHTCMFFTPKYSCTFKNTHKHMHTLTEMALVDDVSESFCKLYPTTGMWKAPIHQPLR